MNISIDTAIPMALEIIHSLEAELRAAKHENASLRAENGEIQRRVVMGELATDCRTCLHHQDGKCKSENLCIDAAEYQRNKLVQLWDR
jgi:hypothetical protein